MRKLTTVGLLLLVFVGLATGQVTLSLPTKTAANGTALVLPVQVTGFNHVGSFSLTISFNKSVLTYTGNSNQPTFGIFNSTPAATANTNGSVVISWFNVSPALNIGSGTLLNLLFTYNSGTSALTFVNTTPSSITDSLGNNLTATYTNGSVSGLPATITVGTVQQNPGDAYVPLTGSNLQGLGSISLRIAYDTSKATFVSLTNPALGFNAGTPTPGVLALSWFSTIPFTLNSGKLTDLHFVLKKDSTALTVQSTSQVTDSVGNNVTITYVNGQLGVIPAPPPPPVGLSIPTVRGLAGKTVSIPVNVTRMNNIGSISLKINYDPTKLTFQSVANFPGSGFVTNTTNGVLSFAWFGTTYLNVGTARLMNLVFAYSGGTSTVGFNTAQSLVTDSVGNSLSLTFTNGVVSQDSLPHFSPITAKTVAQNDTLSFAVLATDNDAGDTLTYSSSILPIGAAFNPVTKLFGWRPSFSISPQTFNVWFYVTDPVGGMDSTQVAITVTKTNRKPSFVTVLRDTTVNDGGSLTFTYTASDPDAGTTLTYSLSSPPSGASIVAGTGVMTFTVPASPAASYTIVAVVSDGSLTDTTRAKVTVNRKPTKVSQVPATAPASISRGVAYTFTVIARDPEGGAITYTWKVNDSQVKTGLDSNYVATFTDPHGTVKKVVCVFADPTGLKDSVVWSFTITAVTNPDGVPTAFALGQNYPNPFNPSTTIRFDLPKEAPVTLEIYNILGVRVRTLLKGEAVNAGYRQVVWDGRDDFGSVVPSGVYLYHVSAGDFQASKKMTLLK